MAKPRPENWKPKDYKDVLKYAVEEWGAVITPAQNGHLNVTFRNGGSVQVSSTPRDRNAGASILRHMIRNGLKD